MTSSTTSERRRQCAKCPWKKSTDPFDIPNGYQASLHAALSCTIAEPGSVSGELRMMACHETAKGSELPCVGWLVHQLGEGNNIPLRVKVAKGFVDANVQPVGEQHETFVDTLPKTLRPRVRQAR